MIDYHCHLLPSIDDGPATLEESIEMGYLLEKGGYNTVYCTPHMIKNLYEATNAQVKKIVQDLSTELNKNGIELNLLSGREYCLDNYLHEYLNDLMPLENTNFLLIELQPDTYPGMVRDTISAIIKKGYLPMIAHPERCRVFHDKSQEESALNKNAFFNKMSENKRNLYYSDKENKDDCELLSWLIANGCAFQENLPSRMGVYGNNVKNTVLKLKGLDIYTHNGTDAHSPYCIERCLGISFDETEYNSKCIRNVN